MIRCPSLSARGREIHRSVTPKRESSRSLLLDSEPDQSRIGMEKSCAIFEPWFLLLAAIFLVACRNEPGMNRAAARQDLTVGHFASTTRTQGTITLYVGLSRGCRAIAVHQVELEWLLTFHISNATIRRLEQ